ncbi:MAG: sulfatase-like hydrolase/transferase, partial [Bacteroidetes bacterium]|nr:sulfatase-like hydrolase/transferase [Bacteroidota bacterium]
MIAATASAGTVFYDFHGSGGATVVDAAAPYNVIQFDTGLGTMNFTGLTDDTGAGGYSLAFTREGTVISTDSGGPDDGTFVAEAYGDGFYMKEPDGGIEIVFGGLDDSRLYELSVFADSGLFLTTDVDFSVGGQSNTGVNTTEAVSFTLAGLQPSGGELLLTIQANGSGKELERGPALNAALLMETGPADPDAPTDLTAAALNQNEIELSWTDNSTVETGFEIQRSSGGGAFAVVDTVATDVTSYVDGGLTPSTAYTYRVRANTGSGPSDDSNEATATTDDLPPAPPDAAPSGLAVEVLAANVLELAWTDASSNETGFSIERDGGAGFTEIATVGEGVTLFRDIGLSPSSTYVYRVVAFNDLGASAPSNTDSATTPALGEGPLNVLMIVLDDMAASAVGHPAYGETHPSIQTPALDRLCDEGLAFTQAYSNWAACMPARQMFMSGKNVEASDWRNNSDIRNQDGMNRSAVYVHQHFQANGYSTVRLDKVFHIGQDVPNGWDITEEPFGPNRQNVVIQANELSTLGLDDNVRRQIHLTEGGGEDRTVYEMDATDESGQPIDADRLTDGITKTRALELLDDFASPGGTFDAFEKPFFMAVGLRRPHLPYVAPAEYYGRFNWGAGDDNVTDPSTAEIVLPPFNRPFTDEAGFRQSLEGYYACTAMSDDHIGDLLDKLDATGLAGNTLVVVFGDNGYGLGEHNNFFSKGTPDNVGFHVPLIFRVPGGARVDEVEEKAVTLMDIYPTLVELCGLPDPNTPLDGKSLAPLLEAHDPNWVEEAYGLIGGSRDASDPLGGLIWARGHKYYEGESGDPREFYAVAAGDRFEWNPLLGSPSLDALEADLDTRLASLRERSLASLPPALDQHAVSQVVAEGGDALFSVRDSGDEVLTVTWTKDGEVLAGETKASLLLEQLVPADAGVYQASVVDRDGRTLSYRAELRVIATPSTLFDWKIDEIEAPFILDGVNGGSFSEVGFVSDSFGPTTKTVFDTGTGGTAIVKPGLPGGDYRVSIWNPTWGNAASD